MALILEDGTGSNPLADTYRGVADLRIYAQLRGVKLETFSNNECEAALIKAMDYLEAQGHRYKGYKANSDQPLQWPRKDVWDVELNGARHPDNDIPRLLEYAQLALALESMQTDTTDGADARQVVKEKVGNIEITYSADSPKQNFVAALSKPAALLAPLFKRNGLTAVRS
jgi:hypothetical protein